ncbi:PEP-CTERM sorting domain-containing protein [Microcoleus sp. herbarium5]|uniref:PEP-CTERM sorting domain-containing protein n=1 Tax=Microcoleus sp. herbarium5 TaxID=3055434 RepID=UPI002FCEFF97
MKNLYHKVAVASVCTALGFALGVNEEAKAATLSLPSTINFGVLDVNDGGNSFDGIGDEVWPAGFPPIVLKGTEGEAAQFAEFNIGSFSQLPNIISAIFRADISSFQVSGLGVNVTNPGSLGIFGYVGNGTADASDLGAGVLLSSVNVSGLSPGGVLNFDVTSFVKQGVSNNNPFAGFGIRALNLGGLSLKGSDIPGSQPRLIVETAEAAEPVPEPTTIFGSAIALGVGGWLKRKKSNQQHKTTSQG